MPPIPPAAATGAGDHRDDKIQDVPVYLDGLGTVQAFNVVQIKAQVNGTLIACRRVRGRRSTRATSSPRSIRRHTRPRSTRRWRSAARTPAQLQSAQLDLKRYQSLATHDFAPIQQVDDQQATVNKDIAAVALDNAAIETAQFNLNNCVIRAPIDGRVSLYQVNVGNLIEVAGQTGTGIVSITQDKPISVVFTLPEADLAQVQAARAKGAVPVEASNSQDVKQVLATGTLVTPNNTIDATTGTISMKATFQNQDDHLWPGEFVNTRVQVDVLQNAVTLPALAVQHGPDGLFVYAVKPGQTVAQANIQVGYEDNGMAVVTKGLAGNQTVVLSGQSRLSPGTHVKADNAAQPVQPPSTATSGSASPS